ncbi:MAG: hypothetical protein K2X45_18535 [Phreatobacter sp.]|nr:hypothetical protein [Phreatobacter sp.]
MTWRRLFLLPSLSRVITLWRRPLAAGVIGLVASVSGGLAQGLAQGTSDWVRLGVVSTASPPENFVDFTRLFQLVPQSSRAHVFRFSDGISAVGIAILDHPGCAVEDMRPDPRQDGTTVPRQGCPVAVGFGNTREVSIMMQSCFFAPITRSDEDRRRNGIYARYDTVQRMVMLRAVVDGVPVPACDAMFTVRPS